MNHFVEKCSCGIVLNQCRCPGHKREMVSPIPCPHQPKSMTDQRARAIELRAKLLEDMESRKGFRRDMVDAVTKDEWDNEWDGIIATALADERRRALEGMCNSGDMWSFLRSVLSQGAAIQQDYQAGKYNDYEEYSARLDCAARERTDQWLADAKAHAGQEG